MKRSTLGFTLMEVLVALVIISISLTAIIKNTSQNIRNTQYLQTKIVTELLAQSILNEALTHLITLTPQVRNQEKDIVAFNRTYHYLVDLTDSENVHIKKIHVQISQNEKPLTQLTTYQYFPHEK